MASHQELEKLFGVAAGDKAFRAKLVANPQQAAQEHGIDLTHEQANTIKGAKRSFEVGGQATDLKLKEAAASLVAGIWI